MSPYDVDCLLRAGAVVCATVIVSNIDQQKKVTSDKDGMALIEDIAENFYRYMKNDHEAVFPRPDKLTKKS